jgi:hypothetical protein
MSIDGIRGEHTRPPVESNEIIIECGVEGGTVALLGIKAANGWRFRAVRNEMTIEFDLMEAEFIEAEFMRNNPGAGQPPVAPRHEPNRVDPWELEPGSSSAPRSESDWIDSWEAALALFDKYPWHTFCPVRVHPGFKRSIWAARQKRIRRDKRDKFLWRLLHPKRWYLFHPNHRDDADWNRERWRELCEGTR